MAEERLIDEDKDRKYKIRINEEGEEELVLIEDEEEQPEDEFSDVPVIEVPVEEEEKIEQEETKREDMFESMLKKAQQSLAENDFESALYNSSNALEINPFSGEANCIKLQALTRNFTSWNSLEESAKIAEGVRDYASNEQKAKLKALSVGLDDKIEQTEKAAASLKEENERKKEERRDVFAQIKNRSFITLLLTVIPFTILLIATIVFSTYMFADENGSYLVATIVLAACTLIAFVCALIASNRFWSASRNIKLNEKDTSTQLGRDYIKCNSELEYLKAIKRTVDDLS